MTITFSPYLEIKFVLTFQGVEDEEQWGSVMCIYEALKDASDLPL